MKEKIEIYLSKKLYVHIIKGAIRKYENIDYRPEKTRRLQQF